MADATQPETLAEALRTIAVQSEELARWRELGAFREAIEVAVTARPLLSGTAQNTLYHLIVETAASVLDAEAASLFLIDAETQELVFEVALGHRMPRKTTGGSSPDGIVGLVAATGQPMAMTDVSSDPRHAAGLAQRWAASQNLLCVPLFLDGEVVGCWSCSISAETPASALPTSPPSGYSRTSGGRDHAVSGTKGLARVPAGCGRRRRADGELSRGRWRPPQRCSGRSNWPPVSRACRARGA